MASTTFIDGQTVIYASWLNDVNSAIYNGTFPNGSLSLTNLNVSGTVTGAGFSTVVNSNLLTPGPIGSTTPNTGKFTSLIATSLTGLTTPLSASQGGTGLTSPGSSGNVLTSNGSAWVSSAPAVVKGLGLGGEIWHSVSKSANVTYTNSYSYPIMVSVSWACPSGAGNLSVTVNGSTNIMAQGDSSNSYSYTFIVTPGSTYIVNQSGTASVYQWSELY